MFDFDEFYKSLLHNIDNFNLYDDLWTRFPSNGEMRFKVKSLSLLKESVEQKNPKKLAAMLSIIYADGADSDFTDILLSILDEKWHISEENIVLILEKIKDPKSIEKLYNVAVNVPDYDDMRALAKKCIWALTAIGTPEAIDKLKLLQRSEDEIISENATLQLQQVFNIH